MEDLIFGVVKWIFTVSLYDIWMLWVHAPIWISIPIAALLGMVGAVALALVIGSAEH